MGTLEQELQQIHDAKIGVAITWLWDGGVDLRLLRGGGVVATEGNVKRIADVLPWLQRMIKTCLPRANDGPAHQTVAGELQAELQKIYDSEINVEISWIGDGPVTVKLRNEFSGFAEGATVSKISDVLPWLQDAIHLNLSQSKHEVERRGGKWKPKQFGPRD